MSNRVLQSRVSRRSSRNSQKNSSETALSAHVAFFGATSSMPCSNCFRSNRSCVIAEKSRRCRECIDRKISCDGNNFADALVASLERYRELDREEDELQARLLEVQSQLLSAMRQKRLVKQRADELFLRGQEIVESDPSSFAGTAGAGEAPPAVTPPLEIDWSLVDPTLVPSTQGT